MEDPHLLQTHNSQNGVGHVNRWNRTESPATNPHVKLHHGHLGLPEHLVKTLRMKLGPYTVLKMHPKCTKGLKIRTTVGKFFIGNRNKETCS